MFILDTFSVIDLTSLHVCSSIGFLSYDVNWTCNPVDVSVHYFTRTRREDGCGRCSKSEYCFSFLSVLFVSLPFPSPRFSCPSFLFTLLFFLCLPFSPLPREEALVAKNEKAVVGNTLSGVCMARDSGLLQGANSSSRARGWTYWL